MRRLPLFFFLLSILLIQAPTVQADQIGSLDFQGLQLGEGIQDYYNGGFGSLGSGPGPSEGIVFSGGSFATGGYDTCQQPRDTCAAWLDGIMDVNDGFSKALSFYSNAYGGRIQVYSGLNGSGVLLADVWVDDYLHWDPFGFIFDGVAHSVVFSGPIEAARLAMGEW